MRKHKILTNTLSLSALLVATGSAFAAISCGTNINDLFFEIDTDHLKVVFCDKGASIYSIKYDDDYMTYQPKDKKQFLRDDFYYGKALGRVTGRIPDGNLQIGDKEYHLEVNETAGVKNNSLHGGTHSFASKRFRRYVAEDGDHYYVSFHYFSPAMEAGYPEDVDAWFVYTIYKGSTSKIDLNITAHTSGITPLNLSTHPFFRLANEGDIKNHTLTIPASSMGQYDDEGKQTVVGVKGTDKTPWDFYNGEEIGKNIDQAALQDPVSNGYDHIWILDDPSTLHTITLSSPGNETSKPCKLTVTTDADGVIMYSNCYPHDGMPMNDGNETDTKYAAITIEPYKFFTVDNVKDGDLNVDPSHPFTRYISYEFSHDHDI